VDVVLAFIAAEALALLLLRRWTGLRPLDVLGQLAAGTALLLALRCALTGGDPRWTAGFLTAALPAHLLDLARRLRRPGAPRPSSLRPSSALPPSSGTSLRD